MFGLQNLIQYQLSFDTPIIQNVQKWVNCRVEIQKNLLRKTFEIFVIEEDKFGDGNIANVDESEAYVDGVTEDRGHHNGDSTRQHVVLV